VKVLLPRRDEWRLIIAGAVLFALTSPPLHLFVPSFLCLVPAAWLILDAAADARPVRRHLVHGFWFGLALHGVLLYWIVIALWHFTPLSGLGYAASVFVLALYVASVFALAGWVHRRTGISLLITLPVFWTAAEWAIGHQGDIRFPWLGLGTSLTGFPTVVQIADVIGARGVTFLLAMANVAIAMAWRRRLEGKPAWRLVAGVGLGVALAVTYGAVRERTLPMYRAAAVAVLQPNVGYEDKWEPGQRSAIFEETLELARSAVVAGTPDLVAWPEAALPGILACSPPQSAACRRFPDQVIRRGWRREIAALASSTRVPQLVGATDWEFTEPDASDPFATREYYNAAFLVDSTGNHAAQPSYRKGYLVPITERVPFLNPRWFELEFFGGFGLGRERPVYEIGAGSFGVIICYESAFEDLARDYRARGADFLLNITNDAWFGRTAAPYQHAAHLVMRAIETRVGIARAANTGISEYVDPLGRVSLQTPLYTRTFVQGDVFTTPVRTLYVRWGDWVGAGSVLMALVLAGVAAWRRPAG
jgi:apolipoprotein N-acyltransferase